ncbi:MAG TPA: hypothetical protein VGT98_01955, partial [Candidatus Elarobacter sp.]|nr:hypothetical protein [Candidatus Elarobacter sp.]
MLVALRVLALAAALAAPLASSSDPSRVTGRVVHPGGDSVVAVPDTWVTLHRVGTDRAGPVDSVRTDRTGRFSFSYERIGASDAIYFASSTYGGVAYFTRPLHAGAENGDDTEITVFDTTSRAVPSSVRGRHLVLSAPRPDGARVVTEVFEISNDSTLTQVARNSTPSGAVWSAPVPDAAQNAIVNEGDIPAQAVEFSQSHVRVYAPFPPGVKQLAYRYTLPAGAFPLRVRLDRPVSVFEVLVEEPAATVTGGHLTRVAPVSIEGHNFTRFLASDVPHDAIIAITVPQIQQSLSLWF